MTDYRRVFIDHIPMPALQLEDGTVWAGKPSKFSCMNKRHEIRPHWLKKWAKELGG